MKFKVLKLPMTEIGPRIRVFLEDGTELKDIRRVEMVGPTREVSVLSIAVSDAFEKSSLSLHRMTIEFVMPEVEFISEPPSACR